MSKKGEDASRSLSRPKVAARPASPAKSLPPAWAFDSVFQNGKILAWSASGKQSLSFSLSPSDTPFAARFKATKGPDWYQNVHPLDRARLKKRLSALEAGALPATIEFRLADSYGASPWVRLQVTEAVRTTKELQLQGFVQDIQAEKDFQLESLRVSEREQNRIGQDLHDDLCQVLAGVSCLMRVTESKLLKTAPDEVPFLREINQQVIEAMQRTRALTHGLFPGKVQVSDIRGALLELAAQVRTRFQIEVKTEFSGKFPKHSSGQIIQLFRIAQEAASNAVKHGEATLLTFHLESRVDEMVLRITDNGKGLGKGTSGSGVGLHIMQFRAGILGGEIKIANCLPCGVCVSLNYPFEN